jgi:hypothetical protein
MLCSTDLVPLSYIAGTLTGNPSIRVFEGPTCREGPRKIVSSAKALTAHGIKPISLVSKEHLSILNGTAFSASVGSLALNDAVHLALLAQVCTAMGTEALLGTQASHVPFLHAVARPHPGQVCISISDGIYHICICSRSKQPLTYIISLKAANSPGPEKRNCLSLRMLENYFKTDMHIAHRLNFWAHKLKIFLRTSHVDAGVQLE